MLYDLSTVESMYDEGGETFFVFLNGDILKISPDYDLGNGDTFQRYMYFDHKSGRWSEVHPGNIR